ncbi:putative Pentatricopeptide repeat-containing protein [Quillaja saponaria]|uniref:Pentatricopeptide repeat-containing protein n=1 Tax=Quillaja saponaria TaxID=32244 RepID=A0AAD7QJ53_QUISA|nr:putative Pentatricopeptide repeat-containing protein [Quillaja saponaria]
MWRSMLGRATYYRRAAQIFRASQDAKVTSSKSLVQAESLHFPTWAVPRIFFLSKNYRFFTQDSTETCEFESQLSDSLTNNFSPENEIQGVSVHSSVVPDELGDAQTPLNGINEAYEEPFDEFSSVHVESLTSGDGEEVVEEELYKIDVEQLENVRSLLQSTADGSLESSLDKMGLTLHEDFVVQVLETPLVLGDSLIRFFKWAWKEKSFNVTTRVVYLLTRSICSNLKKKESYCLWDLIRDIVKKENGVLNEEILNELIISFSKLGKGKAALEVFNAFEELGCVPNVDTYYFTIEALCRRQFFDGAWSVCENMLDAGILPDGEQVGKIISWFCKGRKAKNAHVVYMLAKEKNHYPPLFSVKLLIGTLSRDDETVKLAFEILNDFSGEVKKYAIKPFSAVIGGLCRMKDFSTAKDLLFKMIAEGPPPGNAVFNSIINGYSKAGDMGEALEIVKLMENRGLKPDVYTYTVIMSGYASGGQMKEACQVLREAKKNHKKLSPVTYHTLIQGYCKLGQFDKALKLLAEMKDFGVEPSVDEYDKLIQSLCLNAADWETAEKLLEEMKEKGLYLKGITRALIGAVKEMEKEVAKTEEISAVA